MSPFFYGLPLFIHCPIPFQGGCGRTFSLLHPHEVTGISCSQIFASKWSQHLLLSTRHWVRPIWHRSFGIVWKNASQRPYWEVPFVSRPSEVKKNVPFFYLGPSLFFRGVLNAHASLLPRWRGATPITHSLMHGEKETGISIMEIKPHRWVFSCSSVRPAFFSKPWSVSPGLTSAAF